MNVPIALRRALVTGVGFLCAALCACGPAGESEPLAMRIEPITHGMVDTGDPAVVWLPDANCTGSLIAPYVVLTAAHCVGSSFSPPTRVVFDDLVTLVTVSARVHPAWDPMRLDNDIALLLLAAKAPTPPVVLSTYAFDDSFIGKQVRIVGYGKSESSSSGVKRTGAATVRAFLATTFTDDVSPSATCAGDSGGPAFLAVHGAEVVVGVDSRGDLGCRTFGVKTRIDAYVNDFILPFVQTSSPASARVGGSCGYDAQCASGSCTTAPDSDQVHYCTVRCERDAGCPDRMHCVEGLCQYGLPSPGVVGASCESNNECVGGLCLAHQNGGAHQCTVLCVPGSRDPCPAAMQCSEAPSVTTLFACFPTGAPIAPLLSVTLAGGCAVEGVKKSRSYPDILPMWALALGSLAIRRRECKRAFAKALGFFDGRQTSYFP